MSESKQIKDDGLIGSTWVSKANGNIFIEIVSIQMSFAATTVHYTKDPLSKIHQLDMHRFLEQFTRINTKCPDFFFGVDMAATNATDTPERSELKPIKPSGSHYYYVTYDFKRGGKRGYGKGSIFMCFDSVSEFCVFDAEKVIKQALKKQRVRHRSIIISNWTRVSKSQFDRVCCL